VGGWLPITQCGLGRGYVGRKFRRRAGSPFKTVARAHAYLHTKWHLDLCSHLAATDIGRKLGAVPLFGEVERGLHLTQSRLG